MLNYTLSPCDNSNAPTLVIIHGLFGAIDNWNSQIKQLTNDFNVLALDVRNHGKSPHQAGMTYAEMAEDVKQLVDHLALNSFYLLGHSMGGKIAMQFALTYPDYVSRLVVADIAPVKYPNRHSDVFAGLNNVPLAEIKSRKEADQYLSEYINEMGVRAFLLKNLVRAEQGYAWRMDLAAIEAGYADICDAPHSPSGESYTGPTLFIKGANSNYLLQEHQNEVKARFSDVSVKVIADAGHWLHAEKPDMFNRLVSRFCLA